MPDTYDYTIDMFRYPETFGLMDANGNLQGGILKNGYRIESENPGQTPGIYFRNMIPTILDASDTDYNNRKETELFRFNNNVTINIEYYYDNNSNIVWFYIRYRNKDGGIMSSGIPELSGAFRPSEAYPYDHMQLYYNPFGCDYMDYPGSSNYPHPDVIYTMTIFEQKPQSDFPNVNGFMEMDDVNRHFAMFETHVFDDAGFDAYIKALEAGGNGKDILPIDPEDDTSGPGGGDGDYNPGSDPVGFPDLPITGDAISTGFIRVYNPSGNQLRSLSNVLWSDDFITTIKKIQNDPMEAIISLHSIPFIVPGSPSICQIGNFNSGVAMPAINRQYYSKNLGGIYIPEHWGSALDYSPYVTIDIFLPYLGIRSLQVDDIIGKTIQVQYNIDVISGATVISIMSGKSVLYTYNTNISASIPISSSSYGLLYQSIASAVANTISGATSGGIGGAVGGALGSAVNVALSKHSTVSRGGSISGNSGCLGNFVPYLIIHRPKQSLASGFAHFKGYPSNITGSIGSVSGYTEIESVHLTGIPCTDNERDEINALLYNGVIV